MCKDQLLNGLILGGLLGLAFGFILFGTRRRRPGKRRPSAIFTAVTFDDQIYIIGELDMLELKEGQKATLLVALLTAHGHAAAIEAGTARFVSTDESIVSVEQNPDNELEAIVRGLDGSSNGSATIEFRADGKQGEGVREIVGVITVVCTQGDATVVEMSAGTPEDDDQAGQRQPANVPASAPIDAKNTDPIDRLKPSGSTVPAETPADRPTNSGGDMPKAEGNAGIDPGAAGDKVDDGKVHAGDPGTVTGGPIEGDNPNAGTTHPTPDGVDAGNPPNPDLSADLEANPSAVDPADRIEGGGPGSANDPAEGQPTLDGSPSDATSTAGMTFPEAAAKAKEGDDNASPSNDVTGPGSPSGSF